LESLDDREIDRWMGCLFCRPHTELSPKHDETWSAGFAFPSPPFFLFLLFFWYLKFDQNFQNISKIGQTYTMEKIIPIFWVEKWQNLSGKKSTDDHCIRITYRKCFSFLQLCDADELVIIHRMI
jgi:hypothetical protein